MVNRVESVQFAPKTPQTLDGRPFGCFNPFAPCASPALLLLLLLIPLYVPRGQSVNSLTAPSSSCHGTGGASRLRLL